MSIGGISKIHDPDCEEKTAQQVHPKSPEGIVYGLLCLRIAYEQEGADRCDLPEKVYPHEAVGKHETEHGAEEEENDHEEKLSPLRHIGVVLMIAVHVAHGVDRDTAADYGYDEAHQYGKIIYVDVLHLDLRRVKLSPDHKPGRDDREKGYPVLLIFKAHDDDEDH